MTNLQFDGRVALITGAGRGIGRGYARLLGARGARVVVADYGGSLEGTGGSSHEPADEVVAEIRAAGGEAVASYASVADPNGAASMVEAAMDSFGRLDIVINNAGISNLQFFEELSLDDFRRNADVHYMGTVHVLKAAWPHLCKAKYGRVINTCSEGMLGIHPYVTSYGGAKGGVFGLTRTLAAEAPFHGILVNGIAPRANTRLGSEESVMKTFNMPKEIVSGIFGAMRPELVAPAVAFLAHDSCKLNGEVLVAGGGAVQRLTIQLTAGVQSGDLTPEYVAENIDAILQTDGSQLIPVNPEVRLHAHATA
jgi:NAD(P)-dependent dehydrogenase (short-subunit alcohol dehydrogenase family)